MNNTLLLASIIGPVLIVLSLSEFLNYKIWSNVAPAIVYLNGFFLFTGGLIIIRMHNVWVTAWAVLVTVSGWLCMTVGVVRMFFPSKKQLPKNNLSTFILVTLFLVGVVFTIKSYMVR